MPSKLVTVLNLIKYFPIKGGLLKGTTEVVKAVDRVSFDVKEGETLGLVGESGCGKTTVGKCVIRLIEPTAGKITFENTDITKLDKKRMRRLRSKMQMVFQDPYSSLNPRMTVKSAISEPLIINKVASKREIEDVVAKLIEKVGLSQDHLNRYPHEFSGGQRQRIAIARALALNPKLVVLDEPTSSSDVSVQAQVLNLLKDLQRDFGLTYLFISHDLGVVKHMSTRMSVMYLGKIVEKGSVDQVFNNPLHPYTQALLSAILEADMQITRERIILKGDVPSPINPPLGCRFHMRCWLATPKCIDKEPESIEVEIGHFVSCHRVK